MWSVDVGDNLHSELMCKFQLLEHVWNEVITQNVCGCRGVTCARGCQCPVSAIVLYPVCAILPMCEYCTYCSMCNTKVFQSIQYVQYYPFSSILKYPGISMRLPGRATQSAQVTCPISSAHSGNPHEPNAALCRRWCYAGRRLS